jgi:hypothetical protein
VARTTEKETPADDLPLWAAAQERADRAIEAYDARRQAEQKAYDHASVRWCANATKAVRLCADLLPEFTADDVWDVMEKGAVDPIESERNPAALGPVILAFVRADYIAKTGELRPSRFARRHRDLTVWAKVAA